MRRTISDSKNLVEKMLEDTAKTIDSIKDDIEKTVVDYTFVPGKDIIETDDSIIVHIDIPGIKKKDIDLRVTETKMKVTAQLDEEHGLFDLQVQRKNNIRLKRGCYEKQVQHFIGNGDRYGNFHPFRHIFMVQLHVTYRFIYCKPVYGRICINLHISRHKSQGWVDFGSGSLFHLNCLHPHASEV